MVSRLNLSMTRKISALLLLAALSLGGCKKVHLPIGNKAPEPVVAAASGGPAPASAPVLEPPSKPELSPAAPAARAKPPVDQAASVMVLCYHNIEDNSKMKALTIPVAQFEKEMQAVKDGGFSVIGMQDFLAWRRGEKNIPHKSCVITIDDGWISGYTNAWPILKQHGYPFTMFIYVNYVGSGGKSLSWAQLAEMRDAGVDIQCHTYSHSNLRAPGTGVDRHTADLVRKDLAALGPDGWLRKEIIDSKKVLEQQLGIRVNAIAYPFGIYSAKVRALVKEAGYEAGFTVYGQRLSRSSPFDELGRYAIEAAKPKIFEDALAMIGGGMGGGTELNAPAVTGQFAAASMITQPMDKETIQTATPIIKANLSTMGEVENGSVEMRLSGVGPVPVQYDAATKMATAAVKQPLHAGPCTVILSGKVAGQRAENRWDFTVGNSAPGALKADSAPAASPAGAPAAGAEAAQPAATPAKKKKK